MNGKQMGASVAVMSTSVVDVATKKNVTKGFLRISSCNPNKART